MTVTEILEKSEKIKDACLFFREILESSKKSGLHKCPAPVFSALVASFYEIHPNDKQNFQALKDFLIMFKSGMIQDDRYRIILRARDLWMSGNYLGGGARETFYLKTQRAIQMVLRNENGTNLVCPKGQIFNNILIPKAEWIYPYTKFIYNPFKEEPNEINCYDGV
jgi:hypothetical protein